MVQIKSPVRDRLLRAIKQAGSIRADDLAEQSGVSQKDIYQRLDPAISSGVIAIDVDTSAKKRGRKCRVYRWVNQEKKVTIRPTGAATRTCLGCGAPFKSTHAGNRICPACTRVTARLRAEGDTPFNKPAVVRYR